MKIFFQNFDRNHFPLEAAEKLKCYKRIILPYLEKKMPIIFMELLRSLLKFFLNQIKGSTNHVFVFVDLSLTIKMND